jgi:hypothetical protein
MICLRTLLRIYEKKIQPKKLKNLKRFLATQSYPHDKKNVFLGQYNITKDWNLVKISAS